MTKLRPAYRLPLLALGMLSLLGGVLAGLARLAWGVPDIAAAQAGQHGALMIGAFFGTVISLERAVALGRGWTYAAPAAAGLAGLSLLAGLPPIVAQLGLILAASLLFAGSLLVVKQLRAVFTTVLALGALCWLIGDLAWLVSGNILPAIPWWLAFLILTIAGERLELTRFLPTPTAAQHAFVVIVAVILAGATLSLWLPAGLTLYAAGLLALAVWLVCHDIARRNARQRGLTRFIALALLGGYAWLALAGVLGLAGAFEPGHPWRDAALHAVGLGFVFSMVMGHAPIIFPAVARVKLPYHPAFYLPLAGLHLSLLCRTAGLIDGQFALRREGGLINAIMLLVFVVAMAASVFRGRRMTGKPVPPHETHR